MGEQVKPQVRGHVGTVGASGSWSRVHKGSTGPGHAERAFSTRRCSTVAAIESRTWASTSPAWSESPASRRFSSSASSFTTCAWWAKGHLRCRCAAPGAPARRSWGAGGATRGPPAWRCSGNLGQNASYEHDHQLLAPRAPTCLYRLLHRRLWLNGGREADGDARSRRVRPNDVSDSHRCAYAALADSVDAAGCRSVRTGGRRPHQVQHKP
jgi:hypothetical protein